MLERPTFSPQYHVEVVEPEGVYLLSERGHTVLKGAVHCRLAPLLDGRHTADAIVERLVNEGRASPAEVYYALGLLERKGYAVEVDGAVPFEQAAFWQGFGLDPMEATRRLHASRVALAAFGAVSGDPLAAALEALGVEVVAGPDADFVVAVADDYLQPGLEALNRAALERGRPWLLAKPVGSLPWLGPLFRPGTTGCWACLAQRLRGNREVEGYLQQRQNRATPFPTSRAALASTVRATLGLVATQVALWLAGADRPALEGRVVTLDLTRLSSWQHALVRRPQCPACGDPRAYAEPRPVVLEPRPKAFTADGGHRGATPEQTLARYEHHVSSITGAVSSLGRVPADPDGRVHVYAAGHNAAYPRMHLAFLRQSLRHKAVGKGATDAQARVSAVCEALERYFGRFQGDEPRRTSSYRALGDLAIHPNACMLYSDRQYRERVSWNARRAASCIVPEPLDEEAEIEWSPLWSLTHRTVKYLPTQYLYYAYPYEPDRFYCWADSNGNAAGNSLEEAILQGFLELVERDAVALWWCTRARRPGVQLESFGDRYIAELGRRYRELGRDLWVLDLTTDLEIPTFAAISRRVAGGPEQIIFGFGSHLDPRIGVMRALTEVGQFLPGVQHLDGFLHPDPELERWWKTATVADHPYLLPDERRPPIPMTAYPRKWGDDLRDDVRLCQSIVERQGVEMLVLDQTRADLGLAVVKVVVPGLRFFWPRYAPGRLYDVPVRLGWLASPTAEDELNPVAMFI